jgi:hypothetical protein
MPVFWKQDQRPVLFVHVPKAGGSSFSSVLVSCGWRELYSIRGLHADALGFAHCSPQHWHGEILDWMFKRDCFAHIVAILRDLFERLMSEYRWQSHQAMTSMQPAEWTAFVIDSCLRDPYVFDDHLRPQSDFVLEGASLYRLESDGLARALRQCLGPASPISGASDPDGVPVVLPHLKQTEHPSLLRDQFEGVSPCIVDFYRKNDDLLASFLG